jgi:iron complex outermembrane receptor protein
MPITKWIGGDVKKITRYFALMLSAACLTPGAVFAASTVDSDGLETIVVTASRISETDIQRTPIAITAFSAEQLQRSQLSNVNQLMGSVPNLSISTFETFAEIFIRGIGSTNVIGGNDPSTTVQVDGVYLGRPYSQYADFLDVQRVEVLRGPQGTLYGRNAVGGTINVISRVPTDDFAAEATLTLGDYWQVQSQDYVSGALIRGVLDASIAVDYTRHDPYLENVVPSGNDVFNANNGGVRIQLRYLPTSFIDATTRLDYSLADEAEEGLSKALEPFSPATASILGDYHKVALNTPQRGVTRNAGVAEDIKFTLSDPLMIRSLTSYRSASTEVTDDADATDLNASIIHQEEHDKQFSQELNLVGNYDRFNFVTGLYYYHENNHVKVAPTIVPASIYLYVVPTMTTDAEAAFAQGTYHVTSKFDVTAGIRYTTERKTMDQDETYYLYTGGTALVQPVPNMFLLPIPGNPYRFSTSARYNAPTPKFGVQYSLTDNLMLYASATRGFKSGGYNFSANSAATAGFQPEKVWSYEVGAKSEWLDHRLRVNLTGFYYDYTDLQVQILLAPGSLSIKNAANAKNKGVELEIAATPVKGLELTANLAWLDAKYTSFPDAPAPRGAGTVDASGNYLIQAPPYTGNLAAQYTVPVWSGDSMFLRAEYSYIGKQFFEPTNSVTQMQAGYGLVNLSAGYATSDKKWEVTAWGHNMGDKEYVLATVAGPPYAGVVGAPRTFGVTLRRKW